MNSAPFFFSIFFKATTNIVPCFWSPKQGHTKDPGLGVTFLKTGILCLFYNMYHITSVTEDQVYLFLITYFKYIFHLWI